MEECNVAYEKVLVDLQNKPQEFLDLYALANPIPGARAKVPLLEVTDQEQSSVSSANNEGPVMLTESLVVSQYVAEKFGSDVLLPSSARDRATMRLFTELCGSSFSYIPILRAQQQNDAQGNAGRGNAMEPHDLPRSWLRGGTSRATRC